jgi:DNA polymerase-3 subunit gamma/tau
LNLSSIGKVQKTAEEKPVASNERSPDKPIDEEVLKRAWDEFIQLRQATHPDLSMMKRGYSVANTIIKLTLNGNVEAMLFQPLQTSLITFLRDKTGNSSLLIQTEISEQPAAERRPHTAREKFEHLAAKNPVLKELKDRLGLDPDLA